MKSEKSPLVIRTQFSVQGTRRRNIFGQYNRSGRFPISPVWVRPSLPLYALSMLLSTKQDDPCQAGVEAGENLGFLPGDLAQKINPYLRPLYDAMESMTSLSTIHRLEENGSIEIAPLAYMRGRSLQNAIVILDEAQNTTIEQMQMFLTRLGEQSSAIITGDISQVDLPRHRKSGLVHAMEILQDIEDIEFVLFDSCDVVRSRIVQQIIDAYAIDAKNNDKGNQ